MNRIFKVSGILLWQENVNLTSGQEAALGADTFLGALLQAELPAVFTARCRARMVCVHELYLPAMQTAHAKYTLLIKSNLSVVFNLDSIRQVDHTNILVSTQMYEMSIYIVTVFIFIMLILTPKCDCNV